MKPTTKQLDAFSEDEIKDVDILTTELYLSITEIE